jgi:hypothetical protein
MDVERVGLDFKVCWRVGAWLVVVVVVVWDAERYGWLAYM